MVLVVVPAEGLLACMSGAVFVVAESKTLAWWFSKFNVELQNPPDQNFLNCL